MRSATVEKRNRYFLIIALGALAAGCQHSGKQHDGSRAEAAAPAYYKYFQGTVDTHPVTLQLIKYPGHYDGIFLDDSLGQPLAVAGQAIKGDSLMLVTYSHYNPMDTFRGSFPQPGVFQGTRTDTAGRPASFTLQEIYAPGTIHWNVYTLSDSLAFDTSRNAPQARFRAVLLWPEKKDLSRAQFAVLTDSIARRLYGLDSAVSRPMELLRGLRDSFFASYRTMSRKFGEKDPGGVRATFNWESDYDMQVLWNQDSVISLSGTTYQYTGGAHGLTSNTLLAFDRKRTGAMRLSDIFRPAYQARLQTVLEKHLRVQYDLGADQPLDGRKGMLFNAHLPLTSNFYVTGKGIGFIYNPYEVAPYSYGIIELYVPFREVTDLMR